MFWYAFVCVNQLSYSIVANPALVYSSLMPVLICVLYLVSIYSWLVICVVLFNADLRGSLLVV